MALEGTKYIKLPIAYDDGLERNLVMAVLYGEDANPDYTADGYGTGTTHTAEECLEYLSEKTGVKWKGLTPVCTEKAYGETVDIFGSNNILATTRPRANGIHEFNGYFYGTDGVSTQTEPYSRIQLIDAYGGQLHTYYRNNFGAGGGVFVGNDTRQICLPLVYINPYPVTTSSGIAFREYKLYCQDVNDDHTYFITSSTSVMPFAQFWRLAWTKGGMDLIEERSSDTPPETDDPNDEGGTSAPGGGTDATFDNTSDPINIPGLPGLSAVDTGFVTIYNPKLAELRTLASYMWNANVTDVEFWKKLVANPLDLIIGLNIVPCAVQDGGRQNVRIGYIDTGVPMTKAASQYVEIDCGILTVEKYWDNVMDYSPFTKCQIYLPFIGVQDVNIDEIMGKTIQVVYHIDIVSCACTCFLKCGNAVLYTFNGQCGQNIPVSAANYATMVAGVLGIASAAVAVGVSGGAAAPAAAAITAGASGTLLNGVPIEMTDPMQTGIPAGAPGGGMPAKSSGGGGTMHGAMQSVGNVMALKPSFAHSGSLSGPGGQLNIMKPYLILQRPKQSLPQNYKHYRGYPSNITATLGSLSGYTEVDAINLNGIPATAAELQEIEKLLKNGVYIE